MPVSFQIFPTIGLVYIRYDGEVRVEESGRAFAEYAAHPDCHPGQKHLVDLSHATGFEKDFVQVMQLQASKAAVLMAHGGQSMMVYFAPNTTSFQIARLAVNAWQDVPNVVACIQESESEALSLLGFRQASISDLLADMPPTNPIRTGGET